MTQKIAIILVALCLPAFADFSYEESSKITGGAMAGMMKFAGAFSKQAREPINKFVAVKGDRMVHADAHRASIIDLDKETITDINFDKKQYSVMTFAQMKQMMEEMAQRMQSARAEAKPDAANPDMNYKVSLKDTGEKKQIAGFDTHEVILTIEMESVDPQSGAKGGAVITSDMWLAPKIAGHKEIADFNKRMAQKIAWTPGGMGAMGRPDMAKGMAGLQKEAAKLDGTPVLQVMKMGFHAEGQPQGQSSAQAPPEQQQQAERPSIGSLLGGGFGRKKKSDSSASSGQGDASAQGQGDASGSLMEMTTEMSGFSSSPVDPSKFEAPAGFKQVEPEMMQHHRR